MPNLAPSHIREPQRSKSMIRGPAYWLHSITPRRVRCDSRQVPRLRLATNGKWMSAPFVFPLLASSPWFVSLSPRHPSPCSESFWYFLTGHFFPSRGLLYQSICIPQFTKHSSDKGDTNKETRKTILANGLHAPDKQSFTADCVYWLEFMRKALS